MKITRLYTQSVKVPLAQPLITAIHCTESIGCVLLYIESDSGLCGQSYVFTLNDQRLAVFSAMIESLAPFVVGRDVGHIEAIWQSIWLDLNPSGHKGIGISALSAVDTALWDLQGKRVGLPLHHLFGACRESVHCYASSGLWLSMSTEQLLAQAEQFLEQGFRSMKLRLGKPKLAEDIERVAALRQLLGDEIELLCDVNQGLDVRGAMAMANELAAFNVGWLEEPVAAADFAGHNRVREASPVPIASGETEYTCQGMKAMLDAQSVDVLMPDLQRIGGLSEFRRAASLAASYHVPVSTHIFTEHSLAIAGSASNCISVEHVDWFAPLFNEQIEIRDGSVLLPKRAGSGFSFNEDFIREHLA